MTTDAASAAFIGQCDDGQDGERGLGGAVPGSTGQRQFDDDGLVVTALDHGNHVIRGGPGAARLRQDALTVVWALPRSGLAPERLAVIHAL
jgi:hypothetical protein